MNRPDLKALFAALAPVLAFAVMSATGSAAQAASKDEVFAACTAALQEEFGEAPIELNKMRRNGDRQMAFGQMELSDGSTKQIRCRVRNGSVSDVKFRTGTENSLGGGQLWSEDRPVGAEYVPTEEELAEKEAAEKEAAEKEGEGTSTDEAAAEGEAETDSQAGEAEQDGDTETAAATTESDEGETAASDSDADQQTGSTTEGEAPSGDQAEVEAEETEPVDPTAPKRIRVPSSTQ